MVLESVLKALRFGENYEYFGKKMLFQPGQNAFVQGSFSLTFLKFGYEESIAYSFPDYGIMPVHRPFTYRSIIIQHVVGRVQIYKSLSFLYNYFADLFFNISFLHQMTFDLDDQDPYQK